VAAGSATTGRWLLTNKPLLCHAGRLEKPTIYVLVESNANTYNNTAKRFCTVLEDDGYDDSDDNDDDNISCKFVSI